MRQPLPIPSFFDPKNAALWSYSPDQGQVFNVAIDWKKVHGVKPASEEKTKVHLLLIDAQKDFCFPWDDKLKQGGTLYVGGRSGTGAMDDNARTAEFIYRNTNVLTDVTTTLDTHFAFQIFFAPFWVTADGAPLSPHTLIDVQQGALVNLDLAGNVLHTDVRPHPDMGPLLANGNYPWLYKQCYHYCEQLKKGGKYMLYLWPPHCILGSDGHALAGVIHEARMFFSWTRGTQSLCEIKGGNPITENYSIFQPEVLTRWDGKPSSAQRNARFLKTLLSSDYIVLAGQAASHCVKSSIDDLLTEIVNVDKTLASKVYVMTDCSSAVAIPDGKGGFAADFTADAEAAYQRFASAGMHLVKSTDPIESWPGIKLA